MPFIKRTGKPTLHYRVDDFTDPWKNAGAVLLQHGYGRSSQFCSAREEALRTLGTEKWAQAIYGAPGFLPEGTDPGLRDWYLSEIGKSDVEVLCGLYGPLRHASAQHDGIAARE